MITIEPYFSGVEKELFEVFASAIHLGCAKDYSKAQIQAWVPRVYNHEAWSQRLGSIKPYCAILNNQVVGYADIQKNGFIDHFFVHGCFQGQGIGHALMQAILSNRPEAFQAYSHVSITAKPFFEKYSFKVERENIVKFDGVELNNYIMKYNL